MITTTTATRKLEQMFDELVPSTGKAATEAGEILRAFGRIRYRYLNDGDMIGVDYGNETCNAPARYLASHIGDVALLVNMIWGTDYPEEYEEFLEEAEQAIYEHLESNPVAFTNETEDMWSHEKPEDLDWYDDEEEEEDGWDW